MRSISPAFVVAPPTGAKVRTRLRLSPGDEEVLFQVGEYLGRLAGRDLAARHAERRLVEAEAEGAGAVAGGDHERRGQHRPVDGLVGGPEVFEGQGDRQGLGTHHDLDGLQGASHGEL